MINGLFLVLEAAVDPASVALIANGHVVARETVPSRRPDTGARTEAMVPSIVQCLHDAHLTSHDLTAIIASGGPGGFTSLRSAASIAKGMCFALDIPLYAVSTLELLVASVHRPDGEYVAAIDAGRGEYYASVVTIREGTVVHSEPFSVVTKETLQQLVLDRHATLVGPVNDPNDIPKADRAATMLARILQTPPVDLDSWEPSYGRLAEAQVAWERKHGRPLSA